MCLGQRAIIREFASKLAGRLGSEVTPTQFVEAFGYLLRALQDGDERFNIPGGCNNMCLAMIVRAGPDIIRAVCPESFADAACHIYETGDTLPENP